jgi:hypothetical protein
MRRLALSSAAVLAALAVAVPSVAGGSPKARVRALTLDPLVVHGTHFKARERVRVSVVPGGTRRVVSRANGSFTASFAGVPMDRCNGGSLTILAKGSRGDRAEWALKLPQAACPPQD